MTTCFQITKLTIIPVVSTGLDENIPEITSGGCYLGRRLEKSLKRPELYLKTCSKKVSKINIPLAEKNILNADKCVVFFCKEVFLLPLDSEVFIKARC